MTSIVTDARGVTTVSHDNGTTTIRYGAPGQPGSVAQQIAQNVAHVTQWVADKHTDPVDLSDTVEVLDDEGRVIVVARDYIDVEGFRQCESCGVYAAEGINGSQNCYGFYCENDSYPCHEGC